MFNPFYYISNYKTVKFNVFLFVSMLAAYHILYLIDPTMYNIDNSPKKKNFWVIDIVYFTTMIHTHAAIGDITPGNYILKTIVTLHVILTYLMTFVSLASDISTVIDDRSENRPTIRNILVEHSPLLGLPQ